MAGIVINVGGVFANSLRVSPDLPWTSRLTVYAVPEFDPAGGVRNLGTLDSGVVEGTPIISSGRLLSSDLESRVVFGSGTPDANGLYLPVFEGGYVIAAVTKNLQAGGFGGFITRDQDGEGNVNGRYLVADEPEAGEPEGTVAVGLKNGNGVEMRIRVPLETGREYAILGAYYASGCAENTGFKILWMTSDGEYGIQDETTPSNSPVCDFDSDGNFRKNRVEWGSNANVSEFCESSQFALWRTFLDDADLIAAARAMLGISE
ncbi:hypothetical protein [Cobetia sp. MC34]|uniref:hypothetical protein n=1 Tax=Cobetia sp. MC34 TaxID=2785080 RepID=UPI001BC98F74|nr:hypothetical protein [Cobetia sp. MC34]MBS4155250.1 hypothetical protein [Cobetia sp. MC34]